MKTRRKNVRKSTKQKQHSHKLSLFIKYYDVNLIK